MIFPPSLVRVEVLAENQKKAAVIRKLHKLGVLHITQTPEHKQLQADTSLSGADAISDALLTLEFIAEQTNTHKYTTLSKLPTPLLAVTEAKAFIHKYLGPLNELIEEEKEVELAITRAKTRIENAQKIPFDLQNKSGHDVFVYTSPKPVRMRLKQAKSTHKKVGNTHYLKVEIPSTHTNQLIQAVRNSPLKQVDTSFITSSLAHTKKQLQQELAKQQSLKQAVLEQKHTLLRADKSTLQYLLTTLENHYDAYTISNSFARSDHFFIITGYCEPEEVQQIRQALPSCVVRKKPAQQERAPTKLKNNKLAEQFQPLTELFSTPKYNALDPTILVSFFYPLFFGLMLSDIGYGLILLLASAVLAYQLKPTKRWPATLLALSSASAIVFGLVFGSFFGGLINIPPLYMNSFDAAMPLLYASLAIGLIHLNLAVLLHIIQSVRNKQAVHKTILQASPLILLEFGAASYVFFTPLLGHVSIALAVAALIAEKGAFGILDISGLVGNWFSYARILALGLATSGVALAVNTIAEKALAFGGVGAVLWLLIILIGHAFNLVVSGIGAGINAARLHYVEFFTHFFETGGDAFTPFMRKNYKEVNTLWSKSLAD